MAMNLQMDQTYDISKLIKLPPIRWHTRLILRLLTPFNILKLTIRQSLFTKQDKNPLHDGSRANLTGEKRVAMSGEFCFQAVKSASKSLGVTINDLVTAALSVALKKYFVEKKGDSKTN